ncbi:MAG: tetratricopeptide repeat protein [Burkholderiales bacterium]|nr:tetratricopeptide repeat protein [Burkholderiales bacterium]PZN05806.1 MAG: hypothetical protein DIU74_01530 [Pseudomonadota bacterium]
MTDFGVRDVERTLGLSRSVIQALVRGGFVTPARGPRNAYRFSFRDLIVLKAARELTLARVPPRRITQALRRLRRHLPADVPLSGLRILADGDRVVVKEGARRWRADSGQYLLDFDVCPAGSGVAVVAYQRAEPRVSADACFDEGCRLEASDAEAARAAYERALAADPAHAPSAANLGRLLHLGGKLDAAERVYRAGIARCGPEPLLLFNLGVLLEEQGRYEEACAAYEGSIAVQPDFADSHYNLGLLYEILGDRRKALRHLKRYRQLVR